ncbi:MAG: pyridoxal-phosphate dependent enzyme [Chitinophagia bacterium]|nr:pyridoxal-phosphate dependent enzyme [Chitinophagia bacterium]
MSTSLWTYEPYLVPVEPASRVTLGEGHTPLVRSKRIGPELGLGNLYFKLENLNPTGSYKDRFAAAFSGIMRQKGQRLCIATSSGNTGAALAAYCAAAGIRCVLVIVDGAPLPKVRQMQLYGAETISVRGFGKDSKVTSDVFWELSRISKRLDAPLPVSAYAFCSEGMQGVQTIMYELIDELGPVHVFSPAGGGGLTLAMAYGAQLYGRGGATGLPPKVHCVQPEGNDTIASALRSGLDTGTAIPRSTTSVSGLQVPNLLDADEVVRQCRILGGNGHVVTDTEVFDMQKRLAQQEGIFSEPAGAVALAGLARAAASGEVGRDEKVVCLVTGSGFKDMSSVERYFELPEMPVVETEDMEDIIGSNG